MTNKLVILQTAAPDYRKKFFTLLAKEYAKKYDGNFKLLAGYNYLSQSVKTDNSIPNLYKINNYFLLNRKIVFQTGMWKDAISADRLVMELNPRIISNWLLLICRKILLKKTTFWGHAWSVRGKGSKSDFLRHIMRMLASNIICYTKTQAEELQAYMPNKEIYYAPNSVYYKEEMISLDNEVANNIIYVGRLIKAKKPAIAIQTFHNILDRLPNDSNLIIVGDGEEVENITALVKELKLENRVKLLGHIGEYSKLQKLYATSIASISPGYVGLSITQSFGFGVPMIISRNENHSPEIECAIDGENAIFFETDNVEDFGNQILSIIENKNYWIEKRKDIQNFCQEHYSVEAMVSGYLEGIK